jgi:hypothetical protein
VSAFATPSPSKLSRYSRYGSWQVLAEADFRRGLVTDSAPVSVPQGGVVDVRDFLFDRPGKVRKRGGSAIYSTLPGMLGCAHVSQVPFTAGEKIIAVGNSAAGYFAFDATASPATLIGSLGGYSTNPPVFYNDHLYIIDGAYPFTGQPAIVSNTAGTCSLTNLSNIGTFSTVGCVHAGYLVLANSTNQNSNRLWFSPLPDPAVGWDLTNAYIDTNAPITALASIQGVLIVFHAGSCERILGSIPPGTIGENMSLQPLSGQAGCIDAGSVKSIGGNVYFADLNGIWVSNGASVTSLSSRPDGSGISSLWRGETAAAALIAPFGGIQVVRAGSFSNDYYMVTLLQGNSVSGGPWATRLHLVYQIATGVWTRFQIHAISDFAAASTGLETYAAMTNSPYVLTLSDLFLDTTTIGTVPKQTRDADGAVILPKLTSRVIGSGPFLKAYGDGHITYRSAKVGVSNPQIAYLFVSKEIGGGQGPNFAAYLPAAGTAQAPSRQRFPVSGDGHGFSFYYEQLAESDQTELYAVEIEQRPYEEQADL